MRWCLPWTRHTHDLAWSSSRHRQPLPDPAMFLRHRPALFCLFLVAACCAALYGGLGVPKPMSEWKWMDICAEGGTAVMSALWALLILGSRPGGRVTTLLAGGL